MRYEIVLLAFSALVAAGVVDKRQTSAGGYSNVVKNIQLAASDIAKLKTDVDANGSPSAPYSGAQLSALLDDNQQVLYDIGNGTESVDNSNTFNSADSNSLASIVTSTLVPSVTVLLNDLQTHYPAFSSQGIQGVVSSILRQESASAASFAGAFVTKVSGPATTIAPKISASITSAFNKALSVYAH